MFKRKGTVMNFIVRERDTHPVIKKQNVFITGHPADSRWFAVLADDVLNLWDCKVYVDADQQPEDLEDHYLSLNGMNLVILVITENFLMTENKARDVDFPYLMEKKIPVLPIVLKEGMEIAFNSICGDLHLLNKSAADYVPKLQDHLSKLFGDDELHGEVQNAFAGAAFLSYRKKDREHALQLMNLIHQFDQCLDLAIWYDDFLTLGEDYDEEIDYHLNRGQIFILAVTPNLLEEGNYVLSIEYPNAVRLGKKIIPVELIATDRKTLREKFPGLPECVPVGDVLTLERVLSETKQELHMESNPPSVENDYLLGQAYLKGICVEINRQRGIDLLMKAAEKDHFRAAYELGFLYGNGNGVAIDYEKERYWLSKCVELARKGFDTEGGVRWAVTLALDLLNLSDCYYNLHKIREAKELLLQELEISIWLWKQGTLGTGSNPGNAWLRLGRIAVDEGDYPTAEAYYQKAEEILTTLYQCNETEQAAKSMALVLGMEGELCALRFNMEGEIAYLFREIAYMEKAEAVQKRLVEVYRQQAGIPNLVSFYINLGEAYGKCGELSQDPEERLSFYEKARDSFWEGYQYRELTPDAAWNCLYGYAINTRLAGMERERRGETETALKLYQEAFAVHEDMCKARGEIADFFAVANVYVNLATVGRETYDRELLMEACGIFEMLHEKYPENQSFRQAMEATNGLLFCNFSQSIKKK